MTGAGWEAGVHVEGTRFVNPELPLPEGSRIVINPRVAFPFQSAGWFVIPRAQLSATYYSMDAENFRYETSQSRVLPILSLDSGLIFERDGEWFGRAVQQTLEPRLYYAYIPYRDQSTLPNFDSALADLNYVQFFTENIYSGYDRIVNANQMTLALATRILDNETGAEFLRAAIAQRYYFTPQKVTLPGESPRASNESDLLAGVSAQLGNNWALDVAAQYSAEQSEISRATAGARWQPRRSSVHQCLLPVRGGRCRLGHRPDRRFGPVAAVRPLVRGGALQLLVREPQAGRGHRRLRVQGRLLAAALRLPAVPDDDGVEHHQLLHPAGTDRPHQCRNQCPLTIAA